MEEPKIWIGVGIGHFPHSLETRSAQNRVEIHEGGERRAARWMVRLEGTQMEQEVTLAVFRFYYAGRAPRAIEKAL